MKDFQEFWNETEKQRNELYQQSLPDRSQYEGDSLAKVVQFCADVLKCTMDYADGQLRLYHEWLTKQLSEQGFVTSPPEE